VEDVKRLLADHAGSAIRAAVVSHSAAPPACRQIGSGRPRGRFI
jgi:hypothetical protein